MKTHLPLLKETLQFMVQQLRSDDKLCIVTFDHEVWISLEIGSMFKYLSSAGEDGTATDNHDTVW